MKSEKQPLYVIEEQGVKQKAMIVQKKHGGFDVFVQELKKRLQDYDMDVFQSPEPPERFAPYQCFVCVEPPRSWIMEAEEFPSKRFIFLFFHPTAEVKHFVGEINKKGIPNAKVVFVYAEPKHTKDVVDKIFWFSFSRSKEPYLYVFKPPSRVKAEPQEKPKPPPEPLLHRFSDMLETISKPKVLLSIIAAFLIVMHLLFIPPLLVATGLNYLSSTNLIDKELDQASRYAGQANLLVRISQGFYTYARPTLLLFSLGSFTDDAFQINTSVNEIITTAVGLEDHGKRLTSLVFKKEKTRNEVNMINASIDVIAQDAQTINNNLRILKEKIPTWSDQLSAVRNDLKRANEIIELSQQFLPYFDDVFAKDETKRYLLFFANNMELRPGGGFIGSFGILTMRNYTIEELEVYDVYDADGQLQASVPPPKAIRDHLDQPNWFLRDSAFSPDFPTNYDQALFFLERQIGISEFDGAILLTTTAVQNILEAVGPIYVPDFREEVNKDNFYLKAQLYAESNFFPGSSQKKRFLGSVLNQLLIELENAPVEQILDAIEESFNEKQIVAYFDNQNLQTMLDDMYWSGKTIAPRCTASQENCVSDYLFPYDANLGVNKANFFVSRPIDLKVTINEDGSVQNRLSMRISNDSIEGVFPGGTYKNYFQALLPVNSEVLSVTVDSREITNYDVNDDVYKNIGFLVTVPPQDERMVEVEYRLDEELQNGSGVYQLIIQKQIGSPNSDFQIMISHPENMYVVNNNFSPVVKDNIILYNTTLSTDKIFIIEFFKE